MTAAANVRTSDLPAGAVRRIGVVVIGAPHLGRRELLAHLGRRPEMEVLPLDQTYRADIVLALFPEVTVEHLDQIEDVTARVDGARPGLVVVTETMRREHVRRAVGLGLVSIVSGRSSTWGRVAETIVAAHRGRSQMPPVAVGWLLDQLREPTPDVARPVGVPELSERELEVLRLVADGMSTAEVGEALNYSERTIKNILHAVMTRLRLRTRSQAVAYALRTGALR